MGWARFKALVIQHWALIFFITALLISIFLIPPARAQAAVLFSTDVGCCGNNGAAMTAVGMETIHYSTSGNTTSTISGGGTIYTIAGRMESTVGGTNSQTMFYQVKDQNDNVLATSTEFTMSYLNEGSYDCSALGLLSNGFCRSAGLNVPLAVSGSQQLKLVAKTSAVSGGSGRGYRSLGPTVYYAGVAAPPPPSNAISITYPTNGSTVDVLSFWGVNYTAATSTTYQAYVSPFYTIEITAGNNSSTFEGTLVGRKDLEITVSGSATSTQVIAVQGFIPGITYYAQGDLIFHAAWGDSGLLVATSSVISFTVSTTTFPGTFPSSTNPFPTSTISTSNVCDPNAFFLIYGICRLFVPQASDFVIFNIMKTYVQNKPPFGYIGLTITALNNLGTASSTVQFPDLSGFVFVFDPIRTGINTLFWVLFVFWLLSKFRNIDL